MLQLLLKTQEVNVSSVEQGPNRERICALHQKHKEEQSNAPGRPMDIGYPLSMDGWFDRTRSTTISQYLSIVNLDGFASEHGSLGFNGDCSYFALMGPQCVGTAIAPLPSAATVD